MAQDACNGERRGREEKTMFVCRRFGLKAETEAEMHGLRPCLSSGAPTRARPPPGALASAGCARAAASGSR